MSTRKNLNFIKFGSLDRVDQNAEILRCLRALAPAIWSLRGGDLIINLIVCQTGQYSSMEIISPMDNDLVSEIDYQLDQQMVELSDSGGLTPVSSVFVTGREFLDYFLKSGFDFKLPNWRDHSSGENPVIGLASLKVMRSLIEITLDVSHPESIDSAKRILH